ncbi:MAG: hypothetical protein C0507_00130 [Cyanobacteria bacterium PR.3.49]|nr:hypothetical protein [Cyanobacteria bacterium PR.3.49]
MRWKTSLSIAILFACFSLPVLAESFKATLEKSSTMEKPMFKGVELYLWELDGKTLWTILPGTNRIKMDAEIRNAKDAIKSKEELEKLLSKLAPGEYIFYKDTTKSSGKAKHTNETNAVKKLCEKLQLNYSGESGDSSSAN